MELDEKIMVLKGVRARLLSFHKLLIDREKERLEVLQGPITRAQWLGMLMGDDEHDWLRSISKLVVRIDESLEVNDGISEDKVELFLTELKALFDESDSNELFKENVSSRMNTHPEADIVRKEIVSKLSEV